MFSDSSVGAFDAHISFLETKYRLIAPRLTLLNAVRSATRYVQRYSEKLRRSMSAMANVGTELLLLQEIIQLQNFGRKPPG